MTTATAIRLAADILDGITVDTAEQRAILQNAARYERPAQASVLRTGIRTSAPVAAYANAASTPPTPELELLLPAFFATLAVAEWRGNAAGQWLSAWAWAVQICEALDEERQHADARPIVPASSIGLIAASSAVSQLLALPPDVTRDAVGLAGVHVAGTAPWGTPLRRIAVGRAARVGIESPLIARAGAAGPNGALAVGLMIGVPALAQAYESLVASTVSSEHWESSAGDLPAELVSVLAGRHG